MPSPHATIAGFLGLVTVVLGGCRTSVREVEQTARDDLAVAQALHRPEDLAAALPELRPDSSVADFIRYAVLLHPQVEATWQDWRGAVEAIGPAGSLPDPRVTLEADIAGELMSFMPGFFLDLMNGGRRTAMANEAAAGSEVARRRFATAVQEVALAVHRAWIELVVFSEALELHTAMLAAYDEAAAIAASDYATARNLASLEMQARLLDAAAMHHTEHHATAALRRAARARFKAALGLPREAADPPWPVAHLQPSPLPADADLWARLTQANPDLAVMRSMVDMARAGVRMEESARSPQVMVGAMVDLKASPLMVRPMAQVSLPLWRDRLEAIVRGARARESAAVARVSAAQLELAAEFALMLAEVQEADEMLAYLDGVGIRSLETLSATAEVGYQSGMGGAAMIAETRAMRLELQARRLTVVRQRELAVAELLALTGSTAMNSPTSP